MIYATSQRIFAYVLCFMVSWCQEFYGVMSYIYVFKPFWDWFCVGARVGSNFICGHAAIQLCERYFCHIRETQGGTSIMGWQVSKELTEAFHDSEIQMPAQSVFCYWFFFFFWPCHEASRISIPWPGIKPAPPILTAWSCNHWTAREVPMFCNLKGPEHLPLPNSDQRSYEASPKFYLGARE